MKEPLDSHPALEDRPVARQRVHPQNLPLRRVAPAVNLEAGDHAPRGPLSVLHPAVLLESLSVNDELSGELVVEPLVDQVEEDPLQVLGCPALDLHAEKLQRLFLVLAQYCGSHVLSFVSNLTGSIAIIY